MAPRKGKETPLELCTRATVLGNSISVRMLEYLSTAKSHPHGFRELITEFLDICRTLWSIEAGLNEASRKRNQFPPEMTQELDKKFRQINDDFIVLNHMILKFLDYERKGGFGRLQRGWRMMFADSDIEKTRVSLTKSGDSLRMSAGVFRWSLGDAKADASVGIGYTGLVAALDRMSQNRPTIVIPSLQPPAPAPAPAPAVQAVELPPQLPPVNLVEKSSATNLMPRPDDHFHALPESSDRENFGRALSTRSSDITTHSAARDSVFRRNPNLHPGATGFEDNSSDDTAESKTLIEERILENDIGGKLSSNQVIRLKADPATVPRWTPRQTAGAIPISKGSVLANAVQQKRHKLVEQLLDSGALSEKGVDQTSILRQAVLNQDADSVRLLLLFGAEPNALDKDGLTPLFSATEASFLAGAKMLTKYGADPNLSAGPDSESPLALAIGGNKIEFVQLYLMYAGDANLLMANGNTALIKAISKTTPKKLVELVLSYGSDPNAKNGEGGTALFEAIQANRIDLMALLLDHGADPNLPGPKHPLWPSTYKPKALHLLLSRGADYNKCSGIMELAASINNAESISILLKAGVSPNAKKDSTYTPLCSAIRDNRSDLVTLLLANGADPNLKASEYPAWKCVTHNRVHLLPPLVNSGADLHNPKGIIEKAVAHENKAALTYLLSQGVSPNDKGEGGHTPLTTAIREDLGEFVDLLLAKGADPGVRGEDWPICMAVARPVILQKLLTAVHNPRVVKGVMEMAVVANQLDSVKLLLNSGVSVEDKNGGVFSPLTTAIREHHTDIVRFLLDEAGADPNAPGEHLPIIKAIRRYRGDPEILEMLLARGASINQMYRGWNAVLQAVENGDDEILRILVEKGGGVDLQIMEEESGRSVGDIVMERGGEETIAILIGADGEAT